MEMVEIKYFEERGMERKRLKEKIIEVKQITIRQSEVVNHKVKGIREIMTSYFIPFI